jgi:hypothetical protein
VAGIHGHARVGVRCVNEQWSPVVHALPSSQVPGSTTPVKMVTESSDDLDPSKAETVAVFWIWVPVPRTVHAHGDRDGRGARRRLDPFRTPTPSRRRGAVVRPPGGDGLKVVCSGVGSGRGRPRRWDRRCTSTKY